MLLRACGYVMCVVVAVSGALFAEMAAPALEAERAGLHAGAIKEVGGVGIAIVGLTIMLFLRASDQNPPD
jgi:hypothetical protein